MTTLYIKTHNTTKKQYFGKTIKDPFKYKGSGTYWTKHLKKHGINITTIILGEFEDTDPALIDYALGFSAANDIVLSEDWANLIPEDGLDGFNRDSVRKSNRDRIWSSESKKKISNLTKGHTVVKDKDGVISRVSINDPRLATGELVGHCKGKTLPPRTPEHCAKISKAMVGRQDGGDNPKAKPVSINDKKYSCIKDAMEDTNQLRPYITRRLNSDKYPNYNYLLR